MRSPTVTTIRFQPIIVPSPSATAIATFTHSGMNLVNASRLLPYFQTCRFVRIGDGFRFAELVDRCADEKGVDSQRALRRLVGTFERRFAVRRAFDMFVFHLQCREDPIVKLAAGLDVVRERPFARKCGAALRSASVGVFAAATTTGSGPSDARPPRLRKIDPHFYGPLRSTVFARSLPSD